ncbi:hypothetical protein MXZ85_11030 [Acinetobacter baumannii]|nr:hypothetical protein [Acinetobacter baumannii]MCA4178271.1 hypothetical protein [Acinetobacter baumannii]MCA4211602.1 hypothetical protein [Acinetobacter baumannii]MCA4301128.1 hypothetical protein [Acinetobacter baumannii]MCA4324444.1 hypothetical protein [Acinetobacter baumannii]MCA4381931.1 hypothetical protein [Acinetobacter baumannii]
MITVYDIEKAGHNCSLLAEVDKQSNVVKIYDYNGNELEMHMFRDEVYFNRRWWSFQRKQN